MKQQPAGSDQEIQKKKWEKPILSNIDVQATMYSAASTTDGESPGTAPP